MQWLARAAHMGLDDSTGFGAAGPGQVPGHPVSVRAFGTRFAPKGGSAECRPSNRCKKCKQLLVEIDHLSEPEKRPSKRSAYGTKRTSMPTLEHVRFRGEADIG